MCNRDIRDAIAAAGVRYWQVAAVYGCTDGTFSRKLRRELRRELPTEEKEKIFSIIWELSQEVSQ